MTQWPRSMQEDKGEENTPLSADHVNSDTAEENKLLNADD